MILRMLEKQHYKDLNLPNIHSIEQLAMADPNVLYVQLKTITGTHQDPCIWDVFVAIIHEARTGEKSTWW